jgi:hypothetical protein
MKFRLFKPKQAATGFFGFRDRRSETEPFTFFVNREETEAREDSGRVVRPERRSPPRNAGHPMPESLSGIRRLMQ